MTKNDYALVFGDTGPGSLGAAIAHRLEREGLATHPAGGVDAADRDALGTLFAARGSAPRLIVHVPASAAAAQAALDMPIAEAQQHWRRICLAGSQIGQAAIPRMLHAGQGTLLFLAPAASANAAVAAATAGLRSFAQSMAREFGPKNLHVAFVALDERADADAVAGTVWQLHRQHRTTWTQELDLH